MAKLIIAPSAEDDLNEIVAYIAFELCNPEPADSLLDDVESVYDTLEAMPNAFPPCKDAYLRANGYRQAGLREYLLIYRVEENGEVVRILHYYHGSQDYLVKLLADA